MFSGGTVNPYDDIVGKTTDENLTSENWELILNLCDKVDDEGQEGARNAFAALLKRLAHRNPNVQLYTLSLAEALGKNCGEKANLEIASRAFTQGLEKVITDRTTHDKVKQRALGLIGGWAVEFEGNPSLGVMEDCYNSLKAKNYKFEAPQEPVPPAVDDEIRRKEEEELQRVLEMSMRDKGGRNQWADYSLASSSGAGGSSSSAAASSSASTSKPAASTSVSSPSPYAQPKYQAGYVPARTPSPDRTAQQSHSVVQPQSPQQQSTISPAPNSSAAATTPTTSTMPGDGNIVTRVKALHTFEPTEPGELAFEKGDIIKVVDRGYKDWWRGQLKGRTGIFPVNYVTPMPEPTAEELAKEAQQEAAVFAKAVDVEKLLTMLRAFDPSKDNLTDNEEIQELYRSSMELRPKIVRLIDKYSQKRADLVSMNETFVRARTIFDRMMEESLAKHTRVYEQPAYRAPQYQAARPDSRGRARQDYAPAQVFGWNPTVFDQPGYNAFPAAPAAYTGQFSESVQTAANPYQTATPGPASGHQVYNETNPANGYTQQQSHQGQQQAPGYSVPQSSYSGQQAGVLYNQQTPTPYPVQQQTQPQQVQQQQQQSQPHVQPQVQSSLAQGQPHVHSQAQPFQQAPSHSQAAQVQLHAQAQAQVQAQTQAQTQVQAQAQPQAQAVQEPAATPQAQSQPSQQQPAPLAQGGPPYVFDPKTTYADPNVQAWAQYYAQGGKDLAGSVYFLSIPGLTDGTSPTSPHPGQSIPQGQQQEGHGVAGAAIGSGTGSTDNLQHQAQQEYQQPSQAGPSDFAYAGGSSSQVHLQPLQQAQPSQSPSYSGYSPSVAASTPSWVLPKKGADPNSRSPIAGSNAIDPGANSYFGLTGQFSGMSVGEGSNGSTQHGVGTTV